MEEKNNETHTHIHPKNINNQKTKKTPFYMLPPPQPTSKMGRQALHHSFL
jgi:hypothetical protein